jgi:hypothetical protein
VRLAYYNMEEGAGSVLQDYEKRTASATLQGSFNWIDPLVRAKDALATNRPSHNLVSSNPDGDAPSSLFAAFIFRALVAPSTRRDARVAERMELSKRHPASS